MYGNKIRNGNRYQRSMLENSIMKVRKGRQSRKTIYKKKNWKDNLLTKNTIYYKTSGENDISSERKKSKGINL